MHQIAIRNRRLLLSNQMEIQNSAAFKDRRNGSTWMADLEFIKLTRVFMVSALRLQSDAERVESIISIECARPIRCGRILPGSSQGVANEARRVPSSPAPCLGAWS